jgi:DNA-binding YbaB/EbfC family protein
MKVRLPKQEGKLGAGSLEQLAKQAQEMQKRLESALKELEIKEYSASSGGGMVTAVVSGKMKLISLNIKPEVVDSNNTEVLSDLVVAATNRALEEAQAENKAVQEGIIPNN